MIAPESPDAANPDFGQLSAAQLSTGLSIGSWTSVELTRYFLDRIAALNPGIHAVVGIEADQALEQARQSDRRRAAGAPLGPLDGIPMTIKDAFRIKGYLSTYGYLMFKNYRPQNDCKLVRVLRDCGVVLIGRTAVPTGVFDWNCKNQIHRECVNPIDRSRTPGGSSGGAAAALAAGLTPLELGSDMNGSIRYPAHCCGIYGLRTTDGWLPIEDIGPEAFPAAFRHIATCGPMARNPQDIDLMLAAFERSFPLPAAPSEPKQKLNIACSHQITGLNTDQSTSDLFARMQSRLSDQGHSLSEIEPPFDWDSLYRDWGLIAGHEYTALIPRMLRCNWFMRLYANLVFQTRLGPGAFSEYFKLGMTSSTAQYEAALQRRQQTYADVDQFFSNYDLWMLPVSPSAAIPLSLCGKRIPTDSGEVEYLRYLGSYLGPTAMLGTPALAVPVGRDRNGLPVAVQIHGARFSDRRLVQTVARLSIQG